MSYYTLDPDALHENPAQKEARFRDDLLAFVAFEESRKLDYERVDALAAFAGRAWAIEPHSIGPETRHVNILRAAVLELL